MVNTKIDFFEKEEVKRNKHFFWADITYEWKKPDAFTKEGYTIETNTNRVFHYGRMIGSVVLAILLLVVLFGSIRTVGAGEVGIVTRFGEVNRVAESGLTLKLPLVEGMIKMETRVQKQEVKTDAATKDLQEVKGAIAVNYTLTNETALRVYKELGTNYAETVITPILHESFKQGITNYTAEQLMTNRTDAKAIIQEDVD